MTWFVSSQINYNFPLRTLLSVYITLGEAFNAQQKYTDAELSFQKAEKILMEQKKALQSKVMSAGDEEQDHDLKSELRVAQAKYVMFIVENHQQSWERLQNSLKSLLILAFLLQFGVAPPLLNHLRMQASGSKLNKGEVVMWPVNTKTLMSQSRHSVVEMRDVAIQDRTL